MRRRFAVQIALSVIVIAAACSKQSPEIGGALPLAPQSAVPAPAPPNRGTPSGPESGAPVYTTKPPGPAPKRDADDLKTAMASKYGHAVPHEWGENVKGVKRRMSTDDKVVALTFDACGGPGGSGYDAELIEYLVREQIPATLFINSRWIEANPDAFQTLASNPLFEIENHGELHKPLSVNGKSAYGMKGTASVGEVVDETLTNQLQIEKLTGRKPKLFRAGTAYYDDIAVQIVQDLGMQPVNFDVIGDAGATFSAKQIREALTAVKPGSIVICHMNQPVKATAAGIRLAVPDLRKRGFRFVKLEDYGLE